MNLSSLLRLLISLGKMISTWQAPVSLKYTSGQLILRGNLSEFGKLIKLALKVLSGILRDIYWQVQLKTTHKSSYGLQSQALTLCQLTSMKAQSPISNGAIKTQRTVVQE